MGVRDKISSPSQWKKIYC